MWHILRQIIQPKARIYMPVPFLQNPPGDARQATGEGILCKGPWLIAAQRLRDCRWTQGFYLYLTFLFLLAPAGSAYCSRQPESMTIRIFLHL
jgi:hypothetical protein